MNIKIPIAGSLKSVENIDENNTKNVNIITKLTKYKLKNMLFNKIILKNEIKETLI